MPSNIYPPAIIKSEITRTGAVGPPGPNEVTDETDTNLTGPLFGDGSKVRVATPEEVVSEAQVSALLQAALADYLTTVQIAAAYAPIVHTHAISAIVGLQTALDGKASSTHVHGNISNSGTIGSTANLPLITTTGGAITVGAFGSAANTFCQGNDSRLSDARTPTSHVHGNISNSGTIGSTSGLPIITGASGVLQVGSFGATSGTFAAGDDSRLTALTNLRPVISDQPDSQFYELGDTVGFTVVAGTIANTHLSLSYQWQLSTNNGGSWSNIGGATSSIYTTGTLSSTERGYQYRCLVSNQFGTETSSSALLSIYMLDQFVGAAAAYSLRRLRKDYVGAVVRVRRSSDSAEADFDADEVANGTLASWVGAGNNGFVVTWYDQVGSNNATQAIGVNQPLIVNAGVVELNEKGLPALRFTDADVLLRGHYLTMSPWYSATTGHVSTLTVYSMKTAGVFPSIIGNSPLDDGFTVAHVTSIRQVRSYTRRTGGDSVGAGSILDLNRTYCRFDLVNRTSLLGYVNTDASASISTTDRDEDFIMPTAVLLGTTDPAVNILVNDLLICEVIVYNTDQSASQQAIRNRIVSDYNLTV